MVAEEDGLMGFGAAWTGDSVYIDNLHVCGGDALIGHRFVFLGAIARRSSRMDASRPIFIFVEVNHRALALTASRCAVS